MKACLNIFNRKTHLHIQDVPGVKFITSVFNYRTDVEAKTPYTRGSSWQRFSNYAFLNYNK